MSISTVAGQQFEALLGDITPGLAAAGTITVGVLDTAGNVIVAQAAAPIIELDPPSGTYRAVLTILQPGHFLVEWVAAGEKYMEDVQVSASPAPIEYQGLYPDAPTLVAGATGEGYDALTALTADQQNALRNRAINDIERFTGQSFTPWTGVKVIDGHGGQEEYLPVRLERLDSISLVGITLGPFVPDLSSVDVTDDGGRLVIKPLLTGGGYAVRAMYPEGYEWQRHFPEGPDTIQLTGLWGWSAVPDDVIGALQQHMADQALLDANEMTSTVRLYRRLGLTSIAQGNLRATLGDATPSGIDIEVQRQLEPYIWHGRQGFVV